MAGHAAAAPLWFHGRAVDLLLGAGLAYLLSIPVVMAVAGGLGVSQWPPVLMGGLGLLFNTPHYGATLLRVYERPEERRRYALFSVHATLGLLLAYCVALHHGLLGSFLITLYLTWSPWHFAGQNYGLSLMFLRRRGVSVDPLAKRLLYACFVLSSLLAFLALHVEGSRSIFAPNPGQSGWSFEMIRLGIPIRVAGALFALCGAAYLATGVAAALRLRSVGARAADLLPAGLLVVTQATWFSLPAYLALAGRPEALPLSALYVSFAHSVQYLWITSYYAKRSDPGTRLPRYYAKTLLAGASMGALLALALAPAVFSPVSWEGGLAMLSFSVVNLHHFVLDGAVWKLRDGRVARILLRAEPEAASGGGRPHLPWWVWAAGAAGVAVVALHTSELRYVNAPDRSRVEAATRRLAFIGRENAELLGTLAQLYANEGRTEEALATYRRALGVRRIPELLNNAAWVLAARRGHDPASVREAVALAEESLAAERDDPDQLDTLAVAYAAAGRFDAATRVAEEARRLAAARGRDALVADVSARLALFRAGRPYREAPPQGEAPPQAAAPEARASLETDS